MRSLDHLVGRFEIKNVLKCLNADYDHVIVVVANHKKIPSLNDRLRTEIPPELFSRVRVFSLTGLLEFLREIEGPPKTNPRKEPSPDNQRLDIAGACAFFGVNPSTLYRWIRQGKVPFYRPGREYQFDRDELALIGREEGFGKRNTTVEVEPLRVEKRATKSKKKQDARYRKLLNLE